MKNIGILCLIAATLYCADIKGQVDKEITVIKDILPTLPGFISFIRSEIDIPTRLCFVEDTNVAKGMYSDSIEFELFRNYRKQKEYKISNADSVILFVWDTLYKPHEIFYRHVRRVCDSLKKYDINEYPCDSAIANKKTDIGFDLALISEISYFVIKNVKDYKQKTLPSYGLRNVGIISFSRVYLSCDYNYAIFICEYYDSSNTDTYRFFAKRNSETEKYQIINYAEMF